VATEIALDAVVKIFTVSCSPNYFLPWQNKPQREVTGSGELFVLWFLVHAMSFLPSAIGLG
jgi:hypothetical protein